MRRAFLGLCGLLPASFLLLGCATIPDSAVHLADNLESSQKQNLEDLKELVKVFRKIIQHEGRVVLTPLAQSRTEVQDRLALTDILIQVAQNPSTTVPEKWQEHDAVNAVKSFVTNTRKDYEVFKPWIERAKYDNPLLFGAGGTGTLGKSDLAVGTIQRNQVNAYAKGVLEGKQLPADLKNSSDQLTTQLTGIDNGALPATTRDAFALAATNTLKALFGEIKKRGDVRTKNVEIAGGIPNQISAVRVELTQTLQHVDGVISKVTQETNRLTRQYDQALQAIITNTQAVYDGQRELATSLRRAVEIAAQLRRTIVSGLTGLGEGLEQVGVIDKDQLKGFKDTVSMADKKIAEIAKKGFIE